MLPLQGAPVWSLGQGTRIPQAVQHDKTKMENKFTGSVVPLKIKYKFCSSTFKILYSLAPTFLFNLILPFPHLSSMGQPEHCIHCPGRVPAISVFIHWFLLSGILFLSVNTYLSAHMGQTGGQVLGIELFVDWLTDTIFVLRKLKV